MIYSKSLGRLLGQANSQMARALAKALDREGAGITAEQFRVLTHLWESDGISQTELAVRTMRDRATTTRILDLLVRDGFVERQPDPTDRRVFRIRLTQLGKAIEPKCQTAAASVISQSVNGITVEEIEQLKHALNKLIKNLS